MGWRCEILLISFGDKQKLSLDIFETESWSLIFPLYHDQEVYECHYLVILILTNCHDDFATEEGRSPLWKE